MASRAILPLLLVSWATLGCSNPRAFTGTSERFELDSTAVGDAFVIDVYVPNPSLATTTTGDSSGDSGDDTAGDSGGDTAGETEGEPGQLDLPVVAYVLDGDVHARAIAQMAEREQLYMLVVGISYPEGYPGERVRDYTPTATDDEPSSGGLPAFHDFLHDELVPEIESRYAVDDERRILFGHGLAGLAGMWIAMAQAENDPAGFSDLVLASPTLWWDEGVMLDIQSKHGLVQTTWDRSFFVGVGDLEPIHAVFYADQLFAQIDASEYSDAKIDYRSYARLIEDVSWKPIYADAVAKLAGNT